jgi:hypothetical protein
MHGLHHFIFETYHTVIFMSKNLIDSLIPYVFANKNIKRITPCAF